MPMRDDFCAFILTHGRPDRVHTFKTLQRSGYTGKVYIVIDDEDKTEAEYRKRFGDRVCLIGNVNCGKLDTGTDAEVVESARYALRHGMPGGGYIFSTSNCIYTGMRLSRYDTMLDVWRAEGNCPQR